MIRVVLLSSSSTQKKKRGGTEGEGREARTTTTTRGVGGGELCGTAIVILTVVLQKRVVTLRVALLDDDVSLRVGVGVLALDFLQQRERGRVKCVSDDWAVLVIDEETKHAT